MSGELRRNRQPNSRSFAQAFGMAIIILFCLFGIFISLAVLPSRDSWTPDQLLTSP
jgi:hypothetical protein